MAKKREEKTIIECEGKGYPSIIRFSALRHSLGVHFDAKGNYIVNVPYAFPSHLAHVFAEEMLPKLIKMHAKRDALPQPINGDEVFLFGVSTLIDGFSSWSEERRYRHLKNAFDGYLLPRAEELRKEMGVPQGYAVKSRRMKRTYGINNKRANYLSFSLELVHYNPHIIDSVIIHELAHHFVPNHGPKFYEIVLKYAPDYWESRKKLINHRYA